MAAIHGQLTVVRVVLAPVARVRATVADTATARAAAVASAVDIVARICVRAEGSQGESSISSVFWSCVQNAWTKQESLEPTQSSRRGGEEVAAMDGLLTVVLASVARVGPTLASALAPTTTGR